MENESEKVKTECSKEELEEKEREALLVIKQDLCSWLSAILPDTSIQPDTFLAQLDTGTLLCQVASLIQQQAAKQECDKNGDSRLQTARRVPLREIQCNKKAKQESFHARDNTANFISWCREASIEEAVMFESNGLVLHEDERRVILCLLEVARMAGQIGMLTPKLIELEKEIDELESKQLKEPDNGGVTDGEPPKNKRRRRDSLDEKVLMIFSQCTCKKKLHVVSHGHGKFELTLPSGRKMTIFCRILSDRMLVRVGGGWDSIEHFILKHDPCRQGVSVMASCMEKEVKSLAPEVKVVTSCSASSKTRTSSRPPLQRIAKSKVPVCVTPRRCSLWKHGGGTSKLTKSASSPLLQSRSASTPLLQTNTSPRKRKLK